MKAIEQFRQRDATNLEDWEIGFKMDYNVLSISTLIIFTKRKRNESTFRVAPLVLTEGKH